MTRLDERHVLLVHPLGYGPDAAAGDISRKANIMPPIGLASMAAHLEAEGLRAGIVDCYAEPFSERAIRVPAERSSSLMRWRA